VPSGDAGSAARRTGAKRSSTLTSTSRSSRPGAELGRLFLQHKHDLALDDWTDQQVVERVNDIAAALIGCGQVACGCYVARSLPASGSGRSTRGSREVALWLFAKRAEADTWADG